MDQLVVLQEIYASFSRGGDDLQKIDSKGIEGCCPDQVGKLLEGAKRGRIEEDTCEKLADCLQDVYEIKRLGDICRKAGLCGLALKSYNKALSKNHDQELQPVLQNNLGQTYARQGDLSRAVVYYQKATRGFAAIGDGSGMAHVLGNLGSAYRCRKEWDKAIEQCYSSLKIFEELGDEQGISQMNGSLGRIYAEMGECDLATRYLERSLTDFRRLGDKKSAAWVLDRLGRVACEGKQWDKALGYYNQSLALMEDQGQSHSTGIVLSNLGRMYLEMGDATAACESLERAVQMIPKSMQPGYQNALSGLAAAYSSLAKMNLQKAEDEDDDAGEESSARKQASKYFARSSDRFQELASLLKRENCEVEVAAGIARSCSYLSRISARVPDEEAVALAERAIAALDSAIANSDGQKKKRIESLKRSIAGMKEALSIGFLGSEPWRLMRAVTNSCEYLVGGACIPGEANGCICDALRNLSASMEAEKNKKDPADRLKAAVGDLQRAQKHLSAGKSALDAQSAAKIGEAAKILEALVGSEDCQSRAELTIKDRLNFRPERDVLLLLSSVLTNYILSYIDDANTIYTWDESLKLVQRPISSKKSPSQLSWDPAQQIVLVDARETAEDAANHEECWLVPVEASVACPSSGQVQLFRERSDVAEAVKPEELKLVNEDVTNDANEGPQSSVEVNEISSKAAKSGEEDDRSNVVMLVKALAMVVVLLLTIDAILYLI
ncbi:MAG: photosystem I assembly protein Ycf3 [Methanosaeta sp. PtaB.Bin018]|nr:MAG: photosystem I assembly protein Ycf3 [Methanosaeta sp. PtaB.Bin018]OPY43641.1 MAG: photosystem I assembly protein Ycf3 [Methanosaeta sp. PtaU1.Bin016]